MDFSTIVTSRYACKKFDGKTIPEEKIEKLQEFIKLSASSFGLQPYKILVIKDQATKDKLLPLSFNQVQVSTCSHLLVFCSDLRVQKRIEEFGELMKEQGIPEEKILHAKQIREGALNKRSPEELKTWAELQVYLALGNGLNGAEALGLASCPMAGFDKKAYHKALNLPEHLQPSVLLPIGYPADEKKPKLRFDDLFITS